MMLRATTRPGAARALAWSSANTLVSKFASVFIGIALARMLGPEEFGTFAIALIALLAVLAFNELGVSLAVVRWPDPPERIAPTVNTVAVGSSLLLTVAAMWAAGPFAAAMGSADAAGPVRLLALCILVNGVVATPAAILQRDFRQDQRMVADQVNLWLGAIVSVLLAASGTGAMSLVVGRLVGAGVSAVLLLRFSPLPYRFGWDLDILPRLVRFGLPLAGASAMVFGIGFADQLLVGQVLGPTLLGAYVLASNLASWPVQFLSQPLRQVTPPLFARLQADPDDLHLAFLQVVRPLAAVAVPSCVALSVCAGPVVEVVYGPAWESAAGPLRWLALAAVVRILGELAYDYLVIASGTGWLLGVQVVWLVALVPAVAIGVGWGGLEGAAAAQLVVSTCVVLPVYVFVLRRSGVAVGRVAAALVLPVVSGAVLVLLMQAPFLAGASGLGFLVAGAVLTGAAWLILVGRVRGDLDVLRHRGAAACE
jgi:PST family polysaccharide transporter